MPWTWAQLLAIVFASWLRSSMATIIFRHGHFGASFSSAGRCGAVAKMIDKWAWLML
jgi:hypothetical protein